MIIRIEFIKWLFAAPGILFLVVGVEDRNWRNAAAGLVMAVILFLFGMGVEHLVRRERNKPRIAREDVAALLGHKTIRITE